MAQTVIQGTNHAKHAVITVFTCGLWLPFWILAWVFNGFK